MSCATKARMNRDLLLELVTRFPDDILLKMSQVPYWREQIRELLETRTHDFWYRRTKHLVQMELDDIDADWKNIYYTVVARQAREQDPNREINPRLEFGLGSLETFRVLERIYGSPERVAYNSSLTWLYVTDLRLLDHLIQVGVLSVNDENVKQALGRMTRESVQEMIDPLLSLLSTPDMRQEAEVRAMMYAGSDDGDGTGIVEMLLPRVISPTDLGSILYTQARYGNAKTIRLLLDRVDRQALEDGIRSAAMGGNLDTFRVLAQRLNPDLRAMQRLFQVAYTAGSEDVMLYLYERNRAVTANVDPMLTINVLLPSTIRQGQGKLMSKLLEDASPGAVIAALKIAAAEGRTKMLALALSDPLLELTSRELVEVFRAVTEETAADVLIRDERFNIEELGSTDLWFALRSLRSHIAGRLEGFQKGREMAGSVRLTDGELEALLELKDVDDVYPDLLRYIILKRPSNVELIDWMIESGEDAFMYASRQVLNDKPDVSQFDLVPIWALLSIMLYPTLTLTRVLDRLREAGADQETITRTAQLIGAHIGASRL